MIGKTLSHYKVIEKIGQGGMGEVYRAEDTNLSREVAIKVLPEQFTQDPQRLARFEREAKLLASLNHPNIAAIYGLEEANGVRFLALELVEGETLAERIAKGPVPVEEALEICRQIAEGVEAAHEKGVIHRDLKPANVKVTPEGKVKILDFGLAKAFEDEVPVTDISQSPRLTEEMTRAGVILGTAAYMSPEQAKGKTVDKRTDIFAFGAVLYELLTGRRAFEGETITETLGAIIHKEPDWATLPVGLPSTIRFLLNRCLQKDASRRLQHIDGARILVEEALTSPGPTSAFGAVPVPTRSWTRRVPWILVGLIAGIALTFWFFWQGGTSSQEPLRRFVVQLPSSHVARRGGTLALSRDGQQLAYVGYEGGRSKIFHRRLDETEMTSVDGTEGARTVFFSPDGEWLGFSAAGKLKKIPVEGGRSLTVGDSGGLGFSWGSTDVIVFSGQPTGLHRISAAGGPSEPLTSVDFDEGESLHAWPEILPDGKFVLFTVTTGRGSTDFRIEAVSLETGERSVVLEAGSTPRYSPTGHLLFARSGMIMAVAFDIATLEATGDPVPVVENVSMAQSGGAHFMISEDGTLAFSTAEILSDGNLVWVDREGKDRLVTEERRSFCCPRLSPDDKQIAVTSFGGGEPGTVWIYDIGADSFNRLTFQGTLAGAPAWSPDGTWVAFQSNPDGQRNVYRQSTDRAGQPERLTNRPYIHMPTSWSPDGNTLALSELGPNGFDIWLVPLGGDRQPEALVSSPNTECCAVFSPDGRWIAYVSDELGEDNIYIRRLTGPDVKWQVSDDTQGGREPVWSPDGKELFYMSEDRMMVVSVQTEPTVRLSKPTVLFEGPYAGAFSGPAGYQYYDIRSDGREFLMIKEERAQAEIQVILNWFEELKRLVPTN